MKASPSVYAVSFILILFVKACFMANETKKVTVTVVRDEEGVWGVEGGKSPVDINVDPKDGTVIVSPNLTVAGTIATSVSVSATKVSNEAEASVSVTQKPNVAMDKKTAETIAGSISESDWVGEFGDTPRPPVPPGKDSDPDKPIVIQRPDGSTLVLPPKNPRIKTFVIRFVHWDGTAREYVVNRTNKGWETVAKDGCKPDADDSGIVITIRAACSKTRPVTQIPGPDSDGRDRGGKAGLTCQLNPKTGKYELFDTTGEYGSAVLRDGRPNPDGGVDPDKDLSEWFASRIGFTGEACDPEKKPEPKLKPRQETVVDKGDGVRTETKYAVRDYSRTMEVNEADNLVIRIPNDKNRPVIEAHLTYVAINATRQQLGDNGEIETVPDNGVKRIDVARRDGKYVVLNEKPAYVKFNVNTGTFSIPAINVDEGTEVRLDYRTLVRVGSHGGIIGVYTDDKGTWVEMNESTSTKMDKEALSFVDPRFTLVPPDIAAYKNHFLVLVGKDTGTSSLEVNLFNDKDELVISGNSALAPNGFGWLTTSDSKGYVQGNTNDGSLLITRTVFNGNKGKIVATSWDKSKTMSKTATLDFDYTDPSKIPEMELPINSEYQPGRPFVDQEDGNGIVKVMDKERTYAGTISFMNPTTGGVLNYHFKRNPNVEWGQGQIEFKYVSSGENDPQKGMADAIRQFIRVSLRPEPTFVIPHWCITDYTELKCVVEGNPNFSDDWLPMASTVVVAANPNIEEAPEKAAINYNRPNDTIVVAPGERTNVIRIVNNEGQSGAVEYKAMDMSFGLDGAADWQLVNNAYVAQGYEMKDGLITVDKTTGQVTLRKAKTLLNAFAPVVVYSRGKNHQSNWVKSELSISLVPKPITGPDGLGEIIPTPDPSVFMSMNAQGLKADLLNESVVPRDDKNAPHAFNSQRLQVQVAEHTDTLGEGKGYNLLLDAIVLLNDADKWEIDTENSYFDSPIPLKELVKVDAVKGTIEVNRAGLYMAYLASTDKPKYKGPYLDFEVRVTFAAGTGKKGVFMKHALVALDSDEFKDFFRTRNIFTEDEWLRNASLATSIRTFQEGTWSAQGNLIQPWSRIVHANNTYYAPWMENFGYQNDNFTLNGFMNAREADQNANYYNDPDNYYASSAFGAVRTNQQPYMGIMIPEYYVRFTDSENGKFGYTMFNELMATPRANRTSYALTRSSTGSNNQLESFSWKSNSFRKLTSEKVQGLDHVIYGVRDKDGKMRYLSLRKVKERIKLKDAPIVLSCWTDDGAIPGMGSKVTMRYPGVMFPIPISEGAEKATLGYLNQARDQANVLNKDKYATWQPVNLIKKLREQFGDRYMDEFVPDRPDICFKQRWVLDLISDEHIEDYMVYSSNREINNERADHFQYIPDDAFDRAILAGPSWMTLMALGDIANLGSGARGLEEAWNHERSGFRTSLFPNTHIMEDDRYNSHIYTLFPVNKEERELRYNTDSSAKPTEATVYGPVSFYDQYLKDLGTVTFEGEIINIRLSMAPNRGSYNWLAIMLTDSTSTRLDVNNKPGKKWDERYPNLNVTGNLNYGYIGSYDWNEVITGLRLNMMTLDNLERKDRKIDLFTMYHFNGGWHVARSRYNPNELNEVQRDSTKEDRRKKEVDLVKLSFDESEIPSLLPSAD